MISFEKKAENLQRIHNRGCQGEGTANNEDEGGGGIKRPLLGLSSFLIWPYNYILLFILSGVASAELFLLLIHYRLFIAFFLFVFLSSAVSIFLLAVLVIRVCILRRQR